MNKNESIPAGSLVRYAKPVNEREAAYRFIVREDRGDRVAMSEVQDMQKPGFLCPVEVVSVKDVVLCAS